MLTLPAAVASDVHAATAREWLVTNGLGGYATGTVSGIATRRYHGLLVAALHPPRGRHVLIAHLDANLAGVDLAAHAFPGALHPQGYRYLTRFALDPLPTWRYEVGGAVLEKSVCMAHGRHTTLVRYTLREAPAGVTLTLRPFGAFRDFHAHAHENPVARTRAEETAGRRGRIVMRPYDGLPSVTLDVRGAVFRPEPDPGARWWRSFEHAVERERGLDHLEDLMTPGVFTLDLAPGETAWAVISLEPEVPDDPAALEAAERARLEALAPADEPDPRVRSLLVAADAYRVDRAAPPALLAGHPWFEDWGRDTLIAFTGAYLVPGRFAAGRELLGAFARYVDKGMLPNRFPDAAGGSADYNTVNAPLWFFHAARRYVQYTGDRAFARAVLQPALADIARWFRAGTRYGIRVDADGLVTAGDAGSQLTWMDAKVGDWVVTPRHGKAVEINALWHAALRTLGFFTDLAGEPEGAGRYRAEADRVRAAFREQFWSPGTSYLHDVLRPDGPDPAVRPNALYAVALPGELLAPAQAAAVLARARADLVVPLAMRTLAPGDPRYVGRYRGAPRERDGAYHQGTAWPFLIGAYATALVRQGAREGALDDARRAVRALFDPLDAALAAGGLGHLPEVMDGDAPHRPAGCFAQAWSDCEALRALVEDGYGRGPADDV